MTLYQTARYARLALPFALMIAAWLAPHPAWLTQPWVWITSSLVLLLVLRNGSFDFASKWITFRQFSGHGALVIAALSLLIGFFAGPFVSNQPLDTGTSSIRPMIIISLLGRRAPALNRVETDNA
ncbi:MAG: hypothetical protein ACK4YM_00900 [Novosphingobium sp.]